MGFRNHSILPWCRETQKECIISLACINTHWHRLFVWNRCFDLSPWPSSEIISLACILNTHWHQLFVWNRRFDLSLQAFLRKHSWGRPEDSGRNVDFKQTAGVSECELTFFPPGVMPFKLVFLMKILGKSTNWGEITADTGHTYSW